MKETLATLGVVALKLLSPVILALIGWIGVHLAALIRTRVKNETIQGLLMRLDNAAVNAVKEVEQAFISNLQQGSPADFARARDMALATIKAHFGSQGLQDLEKALQLDGPEAVEKLLNSVLEARVHDLKAQNSTPAGALTGQAVVAQPEKGV
jgi:hypothetical protein